MTIGAIAAVVLAFLAAFRIDTSAGALPLERRQPTTYESTARLFVTQPGFPWGRSSLRYTTKPGQPPVVEGDPDRFASLAVLYAQLANTDRVQGGLSKEDRPNVAAEVVTVSQFSTAPLPMIDIAAKAETPRHARDLAKTVTDSLVGFIQANQTESRISGGDRVVLEVIDAPRLGKVVSPPSPALPALVFFTVLFLTVGGIFVLDNWRGGSASTAESEAEDAPEEDDTHLPRIAPSPPGLSSPEAETRVAAGDPRPQGRGVATITRRYRPRDK